MRCPALLTVGQLAQTLPNKFRLSVWMSVLVFVRERVTVPKGERERVKEREIKKGTEAKREASERGKEVCQFL